MSGVGGELPKGWVWATLGEIADTTLGKMLDRKKGGDHPVPYLRNVNVQWGRIDMDDILTMSISPDEQDFFRVRNGDLLVCEGGEIGRCAVFTHDDAKYVAFQKALHRVRPIEGVSVSYLRYHLEHLHLSGGFDSFSTGSTIKHLPQQQLRHLPVPVPPVAEQQRIVSYLEEKLSKLTAAEGALDSATARTGAFRKSVLLDLIPGAVPSHWERTSVAEAGELDLGRQRHPDWHVGPDMRPYLRVANVFEDRIDTRDVKEMDFSGVFDRYKLSPGDVLLNEGQSPELVGRPAIYRGDPPECAFTNSLLRFRARSDVLPEWALLVFRRHMHVGRFKKEARITTNIAHLSSARLKKVEFPVPPIQEQEQLIKLASERLGALDNLISEIGRRKQQATALRRSLLTEAFAGRLVPQDPNDEPAEKLLARIRAEREAAAPKKRRTRRAPAQRKATHDEAPVAPPAPAPTNTTTTPLTGEQPTLDLEFPS
ncbi:restriction endonuclease subunit S [Streptomyces hygroscopicus]|uniref:restriction endonuclease subunit S n=1 Tax=Streptomyces hygroscopicus TaxID=1912 RepID=UPI0036C726C5